MNEPVRFECVTAGCKTLADDTLRLSVDIQPGSSSDAFAYLGKRGVTAILVVLRDGFDQKVDERSEEEDDSWRKANGKFWQQLIRNHFFRAPEICRAIGSPEKFEEWIRGQRALLGPDDYNQLTGEIRNQPAHVRVVSEGGGTAEKPPYFAVPLSAEVHRFQHQKGYRDTVSRFGTESQRKAMKMIEDANPTGRPGVKWFTGQADAYRAEWASNALKRKLNPQAESRTEVSRNHVWLWVERNDLQQYWPRDL